MTFALVLSSRGDYAFGENGGIYKQPGAQPPGCMNLKRILEQAAYD
jgi:hypothetical protein